VAWVPFNEGWGQYDTERITKMVRALDPYRLVNDGGTGKMGHSGGQKRASSVVVGWPIAGTAEFQS
jgi:hypothetical protein